MKSIKDLVKRIDGAFDQRMEELDAGQIAVEETPVACETCGDLGMIRYEVPIHHEAFGKLFPCPDCEKGQKLIAQGYERKLRGSGLAPKYRNMSFQSFLDMPDEIRKGKTLAYLLAWQLANDPGQPMSLAQAYAGGGVEMTVPEKRRHSLVVTGNYGVGKTGLAASVVNQLTYNGKAVPLYVRVDDLMEEMAASYDDRNKDHIEHVYQIVGMVKRSQVLVLDEFIISGVTDFKRRMMETIVRYRHGYNLPTVVTTNANDRGIEKAWGRRTADVLMEMAHFAPMGGVKLRDTEQPKVEVW